MPMNYDNFLAPMKGMHSFNLKYKLDEFKKLYFEKYAKDILVSCVYDKHNDRYTFFFKIPSGENDKYPTAIMYDVILEFDPPKKDKVSAKNAADLQPYDIYIFSNSPGFIFTFDYVVKHKFGFPHVINFSHLSQIAINKRPEHTNTYEIMTVEKTTWMAFYHLLHNNYLTKEICMQLTTNNKSESFYMKSVRSQPAKLKEIKELKRLVKEERLKEKAKKNEKGDGYVKTDKKAFNIMSKDFRMDKFGTKTVKTVQNIFKRNDINVFKNNMKVGIRKGKK